MMKKLSNLFKEELNKEKKLLPIQSAGRDDLVQKRARTSDNVYAYLQNN